MHCRAVTVQIQPGKTQEAIDIYNNSLVPAAKQQKGFQGAYLMMAARAMGLDCGPMSGFDRVGVDKEFFQSEPETENWTANFICNLGYGDESMLFPRSPRLKFEDACKVL